MERKEMQRRDDASKLGLFGLSFKSVFCLEILKSSYDGFRSNQNASDHFVVKNLHHKLGTALASIEYLYLYSYFPRHCLNLMQNQW
jgi:hypothetical protein